MLKTRVIPALLLDDERLVKTEKFKNSKYVGDPINAIKIFNEKEVDELMVLDIYASKLNREPNYSIIELFASECFMPLCYGGGIDSMDRARKIFDYGVEKICLQAAALKDFEIISKIAKRYGSQSVVVSIDIKLNWARKKCLYNSSKKKIDKRSWLDFVKSAVNAGAGEVLVNSVDRDGTMKGYDLDIIKNISQLVSVPVIALGGGGSLEDFKHAVNAGASAVAAGAMFVFHGPHRAVLINYPEYSKLEEFLM